MSGSPTGQRVIFNADDFGRSHSINEAVIRAHREGVLTTASLMVNGDAFDEAVSLAKSHPMLGVGLHLTLVLGRSTLPHAEIPGLVSADGEFTNNPVAAGMKSFFQRSLRPQLANEIAAQIAKFHATGLVLDHVNGHLNFHLHPTIFWILLQTLENGRRQTQLEPGNPADGSPRPFVKRGEGQGEGFSNSSPVAADVRRLQSTAAPEVDQSLLTSAATIGAGKATFLSPRGTRLGDKSLALPAVRLTRDPFWLNAGLARGQLLYRISHALIFNLLSARARPALSRLGTRHADAVFGLLQNARVNEDYLLRLLPQMPAGDIEIYSHPCLEKFPDEFAALTSPFVKGLTKKLGIQLCRYQDL